MKSFLPRSLAVIIFAVLSIHAFGQKESIPKCTGPSCDTVGIQHKISPWRIGLFVGPAVAFCGSWESTFNSDKFRDKSLFNGIGFNAAFNADYYFNKSQTSRLKFGLGAVAGIQNFFLRKDLDTFLNTLIVNSGSRNPVVQKSPSEDIYLVFGPVLNFSFTKKIRSPYLEASVRGGFFRTTPAAIFAYDSFTGNNIYSVTASDRRYYPGLLATLGFFVPSKNNLWAWGIETTGFRTKVDYIFPGATIYPYTRKNGGFSAGLAVRRRFEKDIPVTKEPTQPIVCEAPEIDILIDGVSMKGRTYNLKKDISRVDSVMLTWKSRNVADTAIAERFTATIHQLNNGEDKIIAKVVCVEENKLLWPKTSLDTNGNGRPILGQYFVTVQSNRVSSCATCVSEASGTGFAVVDSIPPPTSCYERCDLVVYAFEEVTDKLIKYGPSAPDCIGCICPIGTTDRITYDYKELITIQLDSCDALSLNLKDEIVKANIADKIKALKKPWLKKVYVKVTTTKVGECDDPQGLIKEGVTVKNYSAMIEGGEVVGVFEEELQENVQIKLDPKSQKRRRK